LRQKFNKNIKTIITNTYRISDGRRNRTLYHGSQNLMPRLHLTVLMTRKETWRLWKRISKF